MKKYRAPLGWHRRDPRHYRFAVPNEVWEYKLRPIEFVILSFLCYRQARDREKKAISAKAVADTLHLTAATVEKHLTALASKGLIAEDGALTLKCEAGKFFTLPNEVLLMALPPSAFLVYAYLLYCEDRRTHQCHPSYRTIAGATGLSLNTAVKSVGVLTDKRLITVERSCWFNEVGLKRNGNNIYTILPIRAAVEDYHRRQMRELEQNAARLRAERRLNAVTRRHHPAKPGEAGLAGKGGSMERASIRPTDGCERCGIASDASRRKPVCRARHPAVTSSRSAGSFGDFQVRHGGTEYQVFVSGTGKSPAFRGFSCANRRFKEVLHHESGKNTVCTLCYQLRFG